MGEWILKNNIENDWITLLLLSNFILISVIKLLFKHRFNALIRFYDTSLYLNIFSKEKGFLNLFNILFGLFSVLNVSLLIHLFLAKYQWIEHQPKAFFVIYGSIILTIGLRTLINHGGSKLLDVYPTFERYSFLNTTYFFQSALFLFFGLVLYQFALSKTFININTLLIVYLLIWGYSQTFAIYKHFDFIKNGLLYFILYLCAFKLTPWVLLFSKL